MEYKLLIRLRSLKGFILLSVIFALSALVFLPGQAFAVTENSAHIPSFFPLTYDNFEDCNGRNPNGNDHAQAFWISDRGNSVNYQTVTITSSQNSVPLQLNTAAAVCNRNIDGSGQIIRKNLTKTLTFYTGTPTASTPGISVSGITTSSQNVLDYGCINFANMRYVKECTPATVFDVNRQPVHNDFTLSNFNSLSPGTYNVTVRANGRLVNEFNNGGGPFYRCVANNVPAPNFFGLNCPVTPVNRTITVIKPPPPATKKYVLAPTVTCDVDQNRVFASVKNLPGMDSSDGGETVTVTYGIEGQPQTTYTATLPSLASGGASYNLPPPPSSPGFAVNPGLGEKIVATIEVNPGDNNGGTREHNCGPVTRSTRPYFRVYGNDVIAGRPFMNDDNTCTKPKESTAEIESFTQKNSSNQWVGSGSQFAASAANTISGFLTASLHNGATTTVPPLDLAFGNYSGGGRVPIDNGGNDSSGYSGCINNFKSFMKAMGAEHESVLTRAPLSPTGGYKIYNEGDLIIASDIKYNTNNPSWNKLDYIKPIIVVVQGDINIDWSVSRLDGLYVAIPRADGSGGNINTCYYDSSVSGVTYSKCADNQLLINGAFVAKSVKLSRLKGDLRNATGNELVGATDSAEVFNFPPELFLGLSNKLTDDTPQKTHTYDSIVGLPPVL